VHSGFANIPDDRPDDVDISLARIIHESQTRPWDSLHKVL